MNMSRQFKSGSLQRTIPIFLIPLILFSHYIVHSENTTNSSADLVIFFKQAICSPPDVERFNASQELVSSKLISYYIGARAGSNYFLQIVSNSAAFAGVGQPQPVAGRSGTNVYEFSQNAVSY